jgi:tetratricopeptide (TPR) repeat protein
LIRLGEFATMARRGDDAKRFFDAAIARASDDASAVFGRARLRNRLLDHPGTISDASRAIELIMNRVERMPARLEPNFTAYQIVDYLDAAPERRWLLTMLAEAHFLRANAYNVIREFDKAEADGRVLIALDPDDYQGYVAVAVSLAAQGRTAEALPHFDVAAARASSRPGLPQALRQRKEAIEREARKTYPDIQAGTLHMDTGGAGVIIFRDAAGVRQIADNATGNPALLPSVSACMVEEGARALALGKDEAGNVKVQVDMSLAKGAWPRGAPTAAVRRGSICEGVEPAWVFRAAPPGQP